MSAALFSYLDDIVRPWIQPRARFAARLADFPLGTTACVENRPGKRQNRISPNTLSIT